MTPRQFVRLLDIHGADLGRWPEDARAAARTLLTSDPRLRAAWEAEQRLDALLDALPAETADEALAARLAERAMAATQAPSRRAAAPRDTWWRGLGEAWLRPLSGIATAAAVALALLWINPLSQAGGEEVDPLVLEIAADGLGDAP